MLKPHDRIFIRLDKTPKLDAQTDGRPDSQPSNADAL